MLRASALYMVIIIALVIGVICSAIIVAAYFYKSVYQQNFRRDALAGNLQSGINLLLTNGSQYPSETKLSLLGADNDSLIVQQQSWGVFDIGTVKAFIQTDTLKKVFTVANTIDSTKWAALYLIDEDRSLSVSGHTHIRGDVFIPKAGIREAYVNNQAYTGDKRIVIGTKKTSEKKLPDLFEQRMQAIEKFFKASYSSDSTLIKSDSTGVSFLKTTKYFNFKKTVATLSNIQLDDNIILRSDTTLTIDSTAKLDNIIIYAQSIHVNSGFKGNCQLFASDSIYVDKRCEFAYPSCLGVINFDSENKVLKKLTINDFSVVNGLVLLSDSYESNLPPVISLGAHVTVSGQIYVAGLLNLKDQVRIYGSVFANRFMYQTSYTRYENYLINLDIDAVKLSPYYLSSDLLPVTAKKRKVLQWLP